MRVLSPRAVESLVATRCIGRPRLPPDCAAAGNPCRTEVPTILKGNLMCLAHNQTFDAARADAFAGKLLGMLNGGAIMLMMAQMASNMYALQGMSQAMAAQQSTTMDPALSGLNSWTAASSAMSARHAKRPSPHVTSRASAFG